MLRPECAPGIAERVETENHGSYTQHAQEYAAFADASYTWQYIERPAFDRYISDLYRPDVRVLDLGSGNGRVIEHLVDKGIDPENVIGLEPSGELIDIAAQRLSGPAYIKGEASHIPLADESIDLVTANMVIHHMGRDELLDMLHEVYRVLSRNGVFMLVGVDHAHSQSALLHQKEWIEQQTPWGTIMPVYNHNIDDLILDDAYYAGFDKWYGMLLHPLSEGKNDPDLYRKHTSHYARFAARFHKVSPTEKQRRLDNFDYDVEDSFGLLDPEIKKRFPHN